MVPVARRRREHETVAAMGERKARSVLRLADERRDCYAVSVSRDCKSFAPPLRRNGSTIRSETAAGYRLRLLLTTGHVVDATSSDRLG